MAKNASWMGDLSDEVTLNKIVMPGSHDACMYVCKDGTGTGTVAKTITQFHDIYEQLEAGARFFDIRVYNQGKISDVLRTGHFASKGRAILGAYGPLFMDVLQDIVRFLARYRTEVVILKMSLAKSAKAPAIRLIENQLVNYLWDKVAPSNIAAQKLGDVRGRIIITFDKPVGTMESKLHIADKNTPAATVAGGGIGDRSVLFLNGNAPTSNKIATVLGKQNLKRAEQATGAPLVPHLEMFYLTITASTKDVLTGKGTISLNTAREFGMQPIERKPAVPLRGEYMAWDDTAPAKISEKAYSAVRGAAGPNIYMIDFVNTATCSAIIEINSIFGGPMNGRARSGAVVVAPIVDEEDEGYEADDEMAEPED